jgi:hypothetical protein
MIEEAWTARNRCHDWFSRFGVGSIPAFLQDLPDRRWRQLAAEADEFAMDAPVSPAVVLSGHPQDQGTQFGGLRWSSWRAGLSPSAGDQVAMPAQQGPRGDQQTQPPLFGQQPCQRGGQGAFGPRCRRGFRGTRQHRQLLTQHEDLGVLGRLGPCEQHQPGEDPGHSEIYQA